MRAQHHAVVDVKRVLHVARRMVERQVELGEVIIVILHLRAAKGGKAHADERIPDLAVGFGHRMQMPCGQLSFPGLRHIQRFLFKAAFKHQLRNLLAARANGFFQFLFYGVGSLA